MGGIYIWVHFAVRWNIQIRLVERKNFLSSSQIRPNEKRFFLFHVDQAYILISFQVASLKIYITNLVLKSIHFVNLFCTQFAQLNKTAKWQEILRLCLGDIEKSQFILKSGLGKVPFLIKCVLMPLIIY